MSGRSLLDFKDERGLWTVSYELIVQVLIALNEVELVWVHFELGGRVRGLNKWSLVSLFRIIEESAVFLILLAKWRFYIDIFCFLFEFVWEYGALASQKGTRSFLTSLIVHIWRLSWDFAWKLIKFFMRWSPSVCFLFLLFFFFNWVHKLSAHHEGTFLAHRSWVEAWEGKLSLGHQLEILAKVLLSVRPRLGRWPSPDAVLHLFPVLSIEIKRGEELVVLLFWPSAIRKLGQVILEIIQFHPWTHCREWSHYQGKSQASQGEWCNC